MSSKANLYSLPISPSAEHERDFLRAPKLGYEPPEKAGFIRYVEHGAPHKLIRWHFHDEYELHLITATSGKVFVGDYIGQFEPGHLALIGPHLPHNWFSTNIPGGKVPVRDKVIQFKGEAIYQLQELMPELREAISLLNRAKNGIEFLGISPAIEDLMDQLKESSGIKRLSIFLQIFDILSKHESYRTLSNTKVMLEDDQGEMDRIGRVVEYISKHYHEPISMTEVASKFAFSDSGFSRYFQSRTGNNFTDFVNQLRVNKSCQLLLETDSYIANICYEVGFNNIANFNRRFKEYKGMTPKEFRQLGKMRSR